jgi:hypothetical protein
MSILKRSKAGAAVITIKPGASYINFVIVAFLSS